MSSILIDGSKWRVYILQSGNGYTYTGVTTDMKRRLRQHNGELKGGARFTRRGRPWRVIYEESAADRSSAQRRERQIKKMSRARKLQLAVFVQGEH